MIDAGVVAELVERFVAGEDGAAGKSRELVLMLLANSAAPFSRSQFSPGHMTCTGLVVSPAGGERVLLVHHRRLGRWLLPGGHVEPGDAGIWDAARREVVEETGAVLAQDGTPRLISIDVHGIPAKGSEPYHLHHDLIFAFQALSEDIRVSPESHAVAWASGLERETYNVPDNVRRACGRLGPGRTITQI